MHNYLKHFILALAAFLLAMGAFAQDAKISWGKVPDEDLKMTVYDKDTAAVAVVLFDVGALNLDFSKADIKYLFDRHKRVKILKRAGFGYADISIPFYHTEKLLSLRAQIIQPDGKKIAVEKSSFFEEKPNKFWVIRKFAFPEVQEGSVIEFKYSIESESYFQLKEWYFQGDIPVKWSEYKAALPEWFDYVILRQGKQADISEVNPYKDQVTMNLTRDQSQRSEIITVPVTMREYRTAMKDVPAMKIEAFVTTEDDYLARIRFQLKTVTWPQSPPQQILTNWPDVAKRLMEHESFGLQFSKKGNYYKVWESAQLLLNDAQSVKEKADKLYRFVGGVMTWDEDFGIYTRNSLNQCFEQKKGSAAETNLMLLALFKEAGITAYPALTSTRDHGKMFELYPFISQFNHVMILADIEGQFKIFDVGSIYRPAGFPRISALNGQAWVVIPGKPEWVGIQAPNASSTLVYKSTLDEDGGLSGRFRMKMDGYDAVPHREGLHKEKTAEYWQKKLAEDFPDVSVESASITNLDTLSASLNADLQCSFSGAAQNNGDLMYLAPVLMPPFKENPFKLAQRNYPVEIPYPISYQFVLQLDVPATYEVDELPENLNMELPERGGSFVYQVSRNENTLNINYKLRLDQLEFDPEEYAGLKMFFDQLIAKQEEQIVLKKKD
ncbi:MAG TPA: DUF3857 domain-containing protein [Saprospiraceae bacterium]|nr:DUF3857 domain-containing protein [Saprospiraceae bacterium]